jgi:prepilin-type N-terminal cleavage/methylation domain-containing protein
MQKGFSVVEILIAMAIFLIVATAVVPAIAQTFTISRLGDNETDATLYAQEGIEAARSIKNQSWANLVDGNHGLATNSGVWAFSGTSNTKGIYTRQISISDVYRDTSNNVQLSGCANMLDLNTKHATSSATWNSSPTRSNTVALETYFTNWKKTVHGNWALPVQESSYDLAGTNDATKIWTQGHYVYEVRNTGSPNFAIFDITTSTPTLAGSLTLAGNPTDIFALGRYIYVSNQSDTAELQIIDACNTTSPSVVGTFNAAGNGNANGVYVVGNYAYLVRMNSPSDEFVVVNVSNPASPALAGGLRLNTLDNEVYVSGNYAYVASSADTQELQVINISNPASPSLAASLNLATNNDALTISGYNSFVIVGRQNGEVDTIDVTTPTSPSVLGTYNAGANVNDISLGNGGLYAFLATNNNASDLQILDITTLSSPTLLGSFNLSNNINGVAYSSYNDRVYAATKVDTEELVSFKPS